jgi:phosphatidylserine decarboxylase
LRLAKGSFGWIISSLAFIILINIYHSPRNSLVVFFSGTLPLSIVAAFVIYFFRDPKRTPDHPYSAETSILSPADGSICAIEKEDGDLAIYVEMHVTNVHVTRSHISGTVKKVTRIGGNHHPIYFLKKTVGTASKAIRKNARVILEMEDHLSRSFLIQLICGKLARRAKPYVKVGQFINQGDKIGVIAFGSLVKITLPGLDYDVSVKISQNVKAGKTIICERSKTEDQ